MCHRRISTYGDDAFCQITMDTLNKTSFTECYSVTFINHILRSIVILSMFLRFFTFHSMLHVRLSHVL